MPRSALGQTEIMPQHMRAFVPGGTFFISGKAWSRDEGCGLALFKLSALRLKRYL